MNKDLKKFTLLLMASIMLAFATAFSYSAYQNFQKEKRVEEIKNVFNFGETNEKLEDEETVNPKEAWQDSIFDSIEQKYTKVDVRPFYKRIFDKLLGKKVYNYKSIENENETLLIEVKDDQVIEKFFNENEEVLKQEFLVNGDYTSYDLKSYNISEKSTTTFKDVLGRDTYLNTKNGLIEYEDGRTVEFTHESAIKNGPAVENFPNGDRIEFNYVNGKRYGEAQRFYKNGDLEDFMYGENELKNGNSIYHFANGEREEVAYKDGILQGPAIYIYKDGWAEHYEYKDGKRVEN